MTQSIFQIPSSSARTFQCVNGHIVCEKCRPKTLRCPMCRVQMGRGRCLVADKILRYLQNNSTVKIGIICDSGKMSSKIDEETGQKVTEKLTSRDLHAKRSAFMPFKLKLKTITFWKNSWNKWIFYSSINCLLLPPAFESRSGSIHFSTSLRRRWNERIIQSRTNGEALRVPLESSSRLCVV